MKTKNIVTTVKTKLILSALFLLTQGNIIAQSTAPAPTNAISTKAQNLTAIILNVLDIIVFAVAAGAFVWLIIGVLSKAQDVKQRAIYFVIGVVLLGLKSSIISLLTSI